MKQLYKIGTFFLILIVFMTLPGCIGQEEKPPAAPFSLHVIPEYMIDTIPGQRCVFLATVADEGQGSGQGETVNIEATAPKSSVTVIPQAITRGQVAEIIVIPEVTVIPEEGQNVTVTVEGKREGLTQTITVTLTVNMPIGPIDELEALATENQDLFIPWLATNHPELGITSETEWIGTIVRPHILVVMYYLFFSDEWEMGMTWHVMIPPYDWVRIYLRHRTTELQPSLAFEITSKGEQDEPHTIDLKDAFAESVYR
ncbi:MAG: hypothetical protein ACFFCW_19040 [Candidatus Hodarchaeota archaeon]